MVTLLPLQGSHGGNNLIDHSGFWVSFDRQNHYLTLMNWKRPHRHRYAVEGHARYLTFSCFHNLPLLKSERCCQWFLSKLTELHAENTFELWAWVLMPTHVHLLIMPHQPDMVSAFLNRLKKSVANRALNWLRNNAPNYLDRLADSHSTDKHSYHYWQSGGGYDHNIYSIDKLHEKIKYIHANPIRAGLISHPGDWKWSSYQAWETENDIPIPIDRDTLPPRTVT